MSGTSGGGMLLIELLEAFQLFPGKLYSASGVQDINLYWGWCVSEQHHKTDC